MKQDLRLVAKAYDRLQEEQLTAEYAAKIGLPYVNLVRYPFVSEILGLIPEEIARRFNIVAFMKIGDLVRVATTSPFQANLGETMTELGTRLKIHFEPHVASKTSIEYALGLYDILVKEKAPATTTVKTTDESKAQFLQRISNLKELRETIGKISTTEMLETLISGALALEATDIHFEPMAESVQVRFRIDGRLLPIINLPEKTYRPLVSRIKTLAGIKLDLQRIAQDGRLSATVNEDQLDIRVSAVPSAYGQTIEMRLLTFKNFLSLDQLNFPPPTQKAILEAASQHEGLILFTGPTGSGKTTSLYAILQLLNQPDKKVVTIEDPIEYRVNGIEQIQVDPAKGFGFPQALRAVLRQDPDVIMVGEIRDKETAEIAVDAALTGHLVLSTLHTNSASAAFARLIQMGVPKYLLADAITLVVAQRLIRRLCSNCGGRKCDICNQTGFKGRTLIAEHYVPDEQTVELIKKEATLGEFEKQFTSMGNKSLLADGLDKAASGLTTEEEVRNTIS